MPGHLQTSRVYCSLVSCLLTLTMHILLQIYLCDGMVMAYHTHVCLLCTFIKLGGCRQQALRISWSTWPSRVQRA